MAKRKRGKQEKRTERQYFRNYKGLIRKRDYGAAADIAEDIFDYEMKINDDVRAVLWANRAIKAYDKAGLFGRSGMIAQQLFNLAKRSGDRGKMNYWGKRAINSYEKSEEYGRIGEVYYGLGRLKKAERSLKKETPIKARRRMGVYMGGIESIMEPDYEFRKVLLLETVLSFVFAGLFTSYNFTGMAIANLSNSTINWIGAGFFIMGIMGLWGLLRKKKN